MPYPFSLLCNKVFKDLRQVVDHVLWHSERKVRGGQNILELKLHWQTLHQLWLAVHGAAMLELRKLYVDAEWNGWACSHIHAAGAPHSRPSMLVHRNQRQAA